MNQKFDLPCYAERLAAALGAWSVSPDESSTSEVVLRDDQHHEFRVSAAPRAGIIRVYLQAQLESPLQVTRDFRGPLPHASVRGDREITTVAAELRRRFLPELAAFHDAATEYHREKCVREAVTMRMERDLSSLFRDSFRPGRNIVLGEFADPVHVRATVDSYYDGEVRTRFQVVADLENSLALGAFLAYRHAVSAAPGDLIDDDDPWGPPPLAPVRPVIVDPDSEQGDAILRLATTVSAHATEIPAGSTAYPVVQDVRRWLRTLGVDPDLDAQENRMRLRRSVRAWTVTGWRCTTTGQFFPVSALAGTYSSSTGDLGDGDPAPAGFRPVHRVIEAASSREARLAAVRLAGTADDEDDAWLP